MKVRLLPDKFKFSKHKMSGYFAYGHSGVSNLGLLFLLCLNFCMMPNLFSHEVIDVPEEIQLAEALTKLSQKYEVFFSYDEKMVRDVEVTYEPDQYRNIEHALKELLTGTSLRFKIFDNRYIILYEQSQQAISSLKGMVRHLESVIDDQEEISQARKNGRPIEILKRNSLKHLQPLAFTVSGTVVDQNGETLIGVNIQVKGSNKGTATDIDGRFTLEDIDENAVLVISYIGYQTQEVSVSGKSDLFITMESDSQLLDEVVVVGYGTQKKSDLTGAVSSVSKERLKLSNVNVAQAIQGSSPGVLIQTTSAGAEPNESITIRGRNSITASNNPLIVVDGIPYSGVLSDINPNDIESIEILKDASSAAIYGSRGANGVILITSKEGTEGKSSITYNGYYSHQTFSNLPRIMDGKEYFELYKSVRVPDLIAVEEREIYESESWINWYDLILRTGQTQQHNLSVSGGTNTLSYYISGGYLDVKGLTINDNYKRINNQINLDANINSWFKIGTRSNFSFNDKSGIGPSWSDAFRMNPLTEAYDENGQILLYPWRGNTYFPNPLQGLLYENLDKSTQINLNNYAIVQFPFIDDLSYRLNVGLRYKFSDYAEYRGRNTKSGLDDLGYGYTSRGIIRNTVLENILMYNKQLGNHRISSTFVYGYENYNNRGNRLTAKNFPNDYMSWYASDQAEFRDPSYSFENSVLISQMGRLNYVYDDRYLITMTARRDGFSGFGSRTKWGVFPSFAIGWNIANEKFIPIPDFIGALKLRASFGLNGNQAVSSYETISRMSKADVVDGEESFVGYIPGNLGQDELGWESSKTTNLGIDFSSHDFRINGYINYFITNTSNLLLNRSISAVHGFSNITQNIGRTQNNGIEFNVNTRTSFGKNWDFSSFLNFSIIKNKITSLYGIYDDQGNEIDDIVNNWFIGYPIQIYYDFKRLGTWQLDEEEEAKKWGSQPGYIKIEDVNGDYQLNDDDKQIIGQRDPKYTWGLNNSITYKNISLSIFIHGVHGFVRLNSLMAEDGTAEARQNTTKKDWWTPTNPTNVWVMNHLDAEIMGGATAGYYQNAGYIRIKDISLSYNLPEIFGTSNNRIYLNLRNLFTLTNWTGLDPELSGQKAAPLQKEYVIGLNLSI